MNGGVEVKFHIHWQIMEVSGQLHAPATCPQLPLDASWVSPRVYLYEITMTRLPASIDKCTPINQPVACPVTDITELFYSFSSYYIFHNKDYF
jgi:hypothetical protein